MSKETDQLLEQVFKSPKFIEALAYQVAQHYQQRLEDDFGNEVTRALSKHVQEAVDKYAKVYEADEDIKRRVGAAFRRIDKDELLKAIVGIDWQAL